MPDSTHQALSQRHSIEFPGILSPAQLPSAATDLILLGDLTGRYATGSYSRLAPNGRSLVLRPDRQGAAEHGHRITAAIACHVARVGGTLDQLTQLLLHPEHDGGRHARNIALRSGQPRALDYIHRVWASASKAVSSTRALESRHHAYEVLAALRDRIETTPWRGERGRTALRVLRAHLNFAEIAGGPLHHASERQTAEEAGISRTTLRAVYETVLKPHGWLRRLRVGHGREGSTWYLNARPSRFRTTQYPPDPALEEWPTPETDTTADIDSTVLGRLMGHDAFAHHGLGSSALMIISALHQRPDQTIGELVGTSSVSRATAYRTLRRLASHGLVHHTGETWTLAPRALEGLGNSLPAPVTELDAVPAQGWDTVADRPGTTGLAAQRKALHAAQRAAYREALDRLAEHRSKAVMIVRDGHQVLVPALRPDEIPPGWHAPEGCVLDPLTGRAAPDWRIATDGRLILITPCRPAQLRRAGRRPCRSPPRMELRRMTPQHPPTSPAKGQPVTAEALREQHESGATVDELVAASGLSYGTVLNRLHDAGTAMRTSWQTRRMRQDPQARQRLAARLRTLYEQHGATLTELAAATGDSRRAARRLLIEAGGTVRTTQQTLRMRTAARATERQKLALSLRAQYEAGATVPELAEECNYSVATVYRLLHQAKTRMRPQHRHGPTRREGKRP